MSSNADTLTQIRSGDCCRMVECPREAKLLAEIQQLADERTRYRDALYQARAENQQLRDALVAADNALGWIAANHPAAIRELPTAEFVALRNVSVTLIRQLAAVRVEER